MVVKTIGYEVGTSVNLARYLVSARCGESEMSAYGTLLGVERAVTD